MEGSSSSSAGAEATSYSFRANRRKSWDLGSFHRSTEVHDLIAEYFNAVMKRIVSDFVRKLGDKVFQSKEKFASQFEASLMKIRGRLNINPNYTTVEVVLKNFLEDISLLKDYAPPHLDISEDEKVVIAEKAAGIKALIPSVLYFYVKMFEQSGINKDGTRFQSTLEQIYAEVSTLVPSFTSEMKSFCQQHAIDMEALLMNAKDNPLLKLDMNLKSDEAVQSVRTFFAGDEDGAISEVTPPTSNKSEVEEANHVVKETLHNEDTNHVEEINVITPAKGNKNVKKKTPKSSRKRKVEEMEESVMQPNEEEEAVMEVPVDDVGQPAEDVPMLPETVEEPTHAAVEEVPKPVSPVVSAPSSKRSRKGRKSHEPVIEEASVPIEEVSVPTVVEPEQIAVELQPEVEMKISEESCEHVPQSLEEEIHEVPLSKITKRGKSKRRSKGGSSELLSATDEPLEDIQLPADEPVPTIPEAESNETQEALVEPELIVEEVVSKTSAKSKKKGGKKSKAKAAKPVVDVEPEIEPDTTTPPEEVNSNEEPIVAEMSAEETNVDKTEEEVNNDLAENQYNDDDQLTASSDVAQDEAASFPVDTEQPASEPPPIAQEDTIVEVTATPVMTRRGSRRRKSDVDGGDQAVMDQDEVSSSWVESTPRPSRRRGKKADNSTTISASEVDGEEGLAVAEEQAENVVDVSQSVLSPVVPSFRELISTSSIETPQQIANKMRLSFRRFVVPIEENTVTEDTTASRKRKSDEMSTTGAEEFDATSDYPMDVDMDAPLLETVSEAAEDVTKLGKGKKGKKVKTAIAASSSSSEARIEIDGVEDADRIEEESASKIFAEEQTKKKLGRPKKAMEASTFSSSSTTVPRTAELIKEFFPAKKRQRRHKMVFEDDEESEDSDSEGEEEQKGPQEDMILFSKDEVEKLIKGIVAIQQGCALMDTWLQMQPEC